MHYLDATQLIKNVLGLSNKYKPDGFTLLYLWFDVGTEDSVKHRHEIEAFYNLVKGEIDFQSMAFQQLYKSIRKIPDTDKEYLNYIGTRYFPEINMKEIKFQ